MTRYFLEHLSDDEFEQLIGSICSKLFGEGAHAFSKGRDAGRDGYFNGEANFYPSNINHWKGKMIFQAKHTSKIDASCSDNDFFKNKTSVVKKEIAELKDTLNKRKEHIDCYLLFTNRKMSGRIHTQIKEYIQKELGIEQADIVGLEDICKYIDEQKELIREYNISEFVIPDRFYEDDIRKVIITFSEKIKFDDIKPINDTDLSYIDKPEKNKLNDIDEEYFSDIKNSSLPYFKDIDEFLKNPINIGLKRTYLNILSDLKGYIHKNIDRHSFKSLLEAIIEKVIGNDSEAPIFQQRFLVRIFVHYMYWNCDIGIKS